MKTLQEWETLFAGLAANRHHKRVAWRILTRHWDAVYKVWGQSQFKMKATGYDNFMVFFFCWNIVFVSSACLPPLKRTLRCWGHHFPRDVQSRSRGSFKLLWEPSVWHVLWVLWMEFFLFGEPSSSAESERSLIVCFFNVKNCEMLWTLWYGIPKIPEDEQLERHGVWIELWDLAGQGHNWSLFSACTLHHVKFWMFLSYTYACLILFSCVVKPIVFVGLNFNYLWSLTLLVPA